MKKISLLLVLVIFCINILVGCNFICGSDNSENTGNENTGNENTGNENTGNENTGNENTGNENTGNENTEITEKLPTLEELIALNKFEEIFKTHENLYIKTSPITQDEDSTVEDMVLFQGDGKIDYHMRETNVTDGTVVQDVSRIGNSWYYYSTLEPIYTVLELGETYILDYTLPEIFDCLPIGKAYIDGEYIVHHAYIIHEAIEEYDANRIDYTYYFNKESKLLEKIEITEYDHQHVVTYDYDVQIKYDVNVDEIFDTSLMETVYDSDKRIDLEIVLDYNTAEQKSYSFVSVTDALIFATINGEMYSLYTDSDFSNQVMTLEGFTGTEPITLYAKKTVYEEIRYTVTEEEFHAATVERNYTIEQTSDNYHLVHKYTEYALEMDTGIILFIGDKQYNLKEYNGIYVAYDCTSLEITNDGMLAGGYYDEFVFDEETCAYVCDLLDEEGARWDIWFENGVLVRMLVTLVEVVDGEEEITYIDSIYTDVGTTVIEIPEYIFEEEFSIRTTITEDEWNSYANVQNFVASFVSITNGEFKSCSLSSIGNAFELDGEIIVFENDTKYKLEEIDGVWYAREWNDFAISKTLIPSGLNFDDLEYEEETGWYVQREPNQTGLFYSLRFEEGVLITVSARESLDAEDPNYLNMFALALQTIGNAEIDVPEYVIAE